ncbi:LysR family transcriptional regulator [Herbaspirillum seropedicae]|uniref:LysR family transcriptional regulator n=1 Tax=Herbaspirillum seropedicae TaxID=964 RepID=UPI003D98457B
MHYAAWKLFVEALELGSLSKVALLHGTTQPHISRQIAELEQQCGGRLFQRNGRGVIPTELGMRVAPRVRAWLATTEQLTNDIQSAAGTPIGRVRMGILPSAAHPLVSTLYQQIQQRYPQIQLSVREGQGAQLDTWLDNGYVDLALLFRHGANAKNGDLYITKTDTYLVGAPDDPLVQGPTVPFASLDQLPLVSFCRPNSWRDRLDHLSIEHGITLNVQIEADSLSIQEHLVENGGVYALLGPYAIASAVRKNRLKAARIIAPEITRHIALAMSRHGELTLACRTVMQLIKELAQDRVDIAGIH